MASVSLTRYLAGAPGKALELPCQRKRCRDRIPAEGQRTATHRRIGRRRAARTGRERLATSKPAGQSQIKERREKCERAATSVRCKSAKSRTVRVGARQRARTGPAPLHRDECEPSPRGSASLGRPERGEGDERHRRRATKPSDRSFPLTATLRPAPQQACKQELRWTVCWTSLSSEQVLESSVACRTRDGCFVRPTCDRCVPTALATGPVQARSFAITRTSLARSVRALSEGWSGPSR